MQAWQHLDEAHALAQARARDADRSEGRAVGPLHGVPVGLKDIIDTLDLPTEDGAVLHAGRMAGRDVAVVALLRAAGAVILGKTVTTELATYAAGRTRNPHDPSRSSGGSSSGSSSGSAAAVADGMVPLALGTQTNGSVIRPAAFFGVYGYKPSMSLVSRHGILKTSRTLDCVDWFARNLDDIAAVPSRPRPAYRSSSTASTSCSSAMTPSSHRPRRAARRRWATPAIRCSARCGRCAACPC